MSPSPMMVLNAAQTQACLPWPALMQAIAQAARDLKQGKIQAPPRQAVPFPQGGVLLSMPATAADIGVHKLVNVVAGNRERQLPTIHGMVSVYDGQTGQPRLLLDGPAVTTRRTVAVSMLGLSRLLPGGPRHATVFGTGTQAGGHIQALRTLHPDCRIDLIGHTPAKAAALAQSLSLPQLQAVAQVAETSDLVITATTSADPVYALPARAGRLVIAVGAYRADLAEISPATLRASTVYVDELEGARHEAGDLLQAGIAWDRVFDLTDLLDHAPPAGPCVFKTVGCAAWDLAAARCALAHQPLTTLD
ncbi:delta(1)-pyrroline-2-carboxylate reductase family protein [Castellaniella hirudinis]|uniref:delta(1)-pyrroline-2-carboxylate reductase family protein n=1 Tax=Castellaniella hirudinis TaxID=1144617 RepID=UPI0039C0580F